MALALMRRHRRWLYIFLWLVIAAFIILYIPALHGRRAGHAGRGGGDGGRAARLASVSSSGPTAASARCTTGSTRAGSTRTCCARSGSRSRCSRPRRRPPGRAREPSASASPSPTRRSRARSRPSPEFQDDGRFIGTDEIRRRLELQGLTEEDFEQSLRRQLLRQSLESLVGAAVVGERRRGRARVPPAHRAGEARVRARRRRALQGRGPARPRTRSRPASRRRRTPTGFPRSASSPTSSSTAPRCSRRWRSTDRDIELYYQDHREEFRQEEEACASHILVKVQGGRRRRGTPRRRGAEDRAGAPRPGEGRAATSPPSRRSPPRTRAPPRTAATWAASRRGAWCPSSTTRSSPSSPARSPSSSRPRSATTSSASPRSARRRSCRSPR